MQSGKKKHLSAHTCPSAVPKPLKPYTPKPERKVPNATKSTGGSTKKKTNLAAPKKSGKGRGEGKAK
jgi:hypothetical protein